MTCTYLLKFKAQTTAIDNQLHKQHMKWCMITILTAVGWLVEV